MKYYNNKLLPVVVLAGRPNVGKSTLFNRLLRKRRAITDPTPGVTRDPVAAETMLRGTALLLVDTGGFKLERDHDDGLDRVVVERTIETIKTADCILLILEAGDLTSEDENFIEFLRPYQDKLLVVVNKTEGGRRESDAWNLLSLGFEKVHMISAEHGDNMAILEEAVAAAAAVAAADAADTNPVDFKPIRIALLGKPNTGKSTLSNHLTASRASIVSEIPGTTRDVVEGSFRYKNRDFVLLDTAGIRRKTKVHEDIEYYSVNRAIKTIGEADIIFLLIDAQEGLSDQDKKIAALAHKEGRGIVLVLNKWDTMPDLKNSFTAVSDRIRFLFGQMEYAPIIPISAREGTGMGELLDTALKMYRQLQKHIDTSDLNRALETWLTEYPPPQGPNTRFKIRYAVQVSENPVRFVFFASRPQAVTEAYTAYLRNRIRKTLGFSLIPVDVEIRSDPGRSAEARGRRPSGGKHR